MRHKEREAIRKVTEVLRSMKKGYTEEGLELTRRHAFGEILPSDIEEYRNQQRQAIMGTLTSLSPRDIIGPVSIQTADRALNALDQTSNEQLVSRLRSQAYTKLAKWGKLE